MIHDFADERFEQRKEYECFWVSIEKLLDAVYLSQDIICSNPEMLFSGYWRQIEMIYKMEFDMDRIDEAIKEGKNTIWAEATNMGEIVYDDIKKGFFHNIILTPRIIHNWPCVEFYYSSMASDLESDYLLNIKRWPIVHIKVMNEFNRREIKGVQYFPIKLVDVITKKVNNHYVLMYIENFIDAFDMIKSKYRYNKEYDFYTFIPKETYLDEKACSKYDIFRCSKSVAGIYVSEKIKQIVDENAWIGFSFFEQQ